MTSSERPFRSALAPENLRTIQDGTHRYSWRGVPLWKNPFDFALYWLLVWHAKPGTIIEIGSKFGGSALCFADMMQIYGLMPRVVSVDIQPPAGLGDARIDFREGDSSNLAASLDDAYLRGLPRPWLVIDDASHMYEHCLAMLDFFHPRLAVGEFLVMEDGNIDDLGLSQRYHGGPNRAIKEFMEKHGSEYALVTDLCDFWGYNLTWNTNGYWRRIA